MMDNYSDYRGLAYCSFQNGIDSYCLLKTIEVSTSALFALICIVEIYQQIRTYGFNLHWRIISIVFMLCSLVTNVFFCIWHQVYELYSIESYFNNLYFLTIVAYVFRLYMKKNRWDELPCRKPIFFFVVLLMGLLYTLILIDSLISENGLNWNCEEIWYLSVNVICLSLCLIALIVLLINQREERIRLEKFNYEQEKLNSPFKALWLWIGMNTIAQLIDLIETGLLIHATPAQSCMIIPGQETANNILMFFFAISTLYVGYGATLCYYMHLRKMTQPDISNDYSANFSQEIRVSYGMEMFGGSLDIS